MAHKTLVGGTAYEVKGGRCLVDGTAYSIQKGRTLVDGTGYDILFATGVVAVYIMGTGSSNRGNVIINGTKYTKGDAAIEVNAGDSITFTIGADDSSKTGEVTVNGETYLSKKGGSVQGSWTVPDDCRSIKIMLSTTEYEDDEGELHEYCTIVVNTYSTSASFATVTGTGNASYCFATINDKKYYAAKSDIVVFAGDVITFKVYGYSSTYYGEVMIDGTQVHKETGRTSSTYDWTVPDGVTSIAIAMTYTSTSTRRNGRITVTTT